MSNVDTGRLPDARPCPRCRRPVGGFFAIDRWQQARHKNRVGMWCKQRRAPVTGEVLAPTDRQLQLLRHIADDILSGAHPTIRGLGSKLGGVTTNAVLDHVKALAKKGMVTEVGAAHTPGRLRLTAAGFAALGIQTCPHCAGTGMRS